MSVNLSDEWMTPPDFIDLVKKFFDGYIELDPASNSVAQSYINAREYYSIQEGRDGLSLPWGPKKVFCNPPYSRNLVKNFATKAVIEFTRNKSEIVMLVNSSTDSSWYHLLAEYSSVVLLWRNRLKFWKIVGPDALPEWTLKHSDSLKLGNSPRYLNTVFYLGKNPERFIKTFDQCGTFFTPVKDL